MYAGYEALIEIETLAIYRGTLPRRALAMVLEGAALKRNELRKDWDLAQCGVPLKPIEPLD